MAELILSPIAGEIVQGLRSEAVKQIALIWGVKEELQELEDTISTIKAVLIDAEEKQVHNNQVRLWLERLSDSVHDADDLTDEFNTEALRRQLMPGKNITKKVLTFFSSSNQLAFRYKMGRRIKEIKGSLSKVCKDRTFHLEERIEENVVVTRRDRETHSFVSQEGVIGRDNDRNEIIRLLLDENLAEGVSVVSIVGMGGLGKTTLAQSVFNDKKVQQHFELKIWVCVSDNFELKLVLQQIIDSATNTKSSGDVGSLDTLQKELRDLVGGKRYLLVLDDVWEENREKWLKLRDLLVCGADGSRVVVTTRSSVVAEITSTPRLVYHLGILDDETSWSLFIKTAFKPGQEPENPDLVEIARDIVRKCGGIPLAIRAIGSMLYSRTPEVESWSLFNKEFSTIITQQQGNDILPTLKLSYDRLSSNLKHCFAYCRLFPKDERIDVSMLINLWMAQGFLKLPYSSNQTVEDVGYGCFVELYERSFFQEVELDEWGAVTSFKMHDLMHDLAIKVAGLHFEEESVEYQGGINKNTRHVSIDFRICPAECISTSLLNATKLRTMLFLNLESTRSHEMVCEITSFMLLRTLDLRYFGIKNFPESIGKLKHLRYLDLSWSMNITRLPDTITNLVNLQTLKINMCWNLQELPRDIKKLINLRHLELDGCYKLTHMPQGMSQLTNLQTLSTYVLPSPNTPVPRESGNLMELEGLNNLRGKLEIQNFQQCEREFTVFNEKQHLRFLILIADFSSSVPGVKSVTLEGLHPLTNLVSLSLAYFDTCKLLIPVRQFHGLKELRIVYMKFLESIDETNNDNNDNNNNTEVNDILLPYFPSLSILYIYRCPELTSMPLFPHVKDLTLHNTSMKPFEHTSTSSFSPLSKLKRLNIKSIDMEFLPGWFKSLTSLESLDICNCSQLTDLNPGLQYLSGLKRLVISSCDELKSIPECIVRLTSVETLFIKNCPVLLKRCKRHTGEDWPKIANIPHLELSPDLNKETDDPNNV